MIRSYGSGQEAKWQSGFIADIARAHTVDLWDISVSWETLQLTSQDFGPLYIEWHNGRHSISTRPYLFVRSGSGTISTTKDKSHLWMIQVLSDKHT